MKIKEVLVSGAVLICASSGVMGNPSELVQSKHLESDLRSSEFASANGKSKVWLDGLNFVPVKEYAVPFTWSRQYGTAINSGGSLITKLDDIPPGPDWPLHVSMKDPELVISGLPGNITGMWLDDMTAPVSVRLGGDAETYNPNQYGDAFVNVWGKIAESPNGGFAIAEFLDSDVANRGDRGGNRSVSVVPEANTGWVLCPFLGAVLLFAWRQFSRAKA